MAVGQAIQSAGGGGFGARRAPLGLSWEQEEAFPAGLEERAQKGQILRAPQMHPHLCQATGQKVSLAYVYRLLHRHHGRKLGPRPRHVKADRERQEEFGERPPQILREALAQRPPGMPGRLFFQDEAPCGRLSDHRHCWPLWPERPVVGQQAIREYVWIKALHLT